MSLSTAFEQPEARDAVIDDCCRLIDDEVGKKRGMGGLVIKTGYKAVRGIKPGFVRKVVSSLLDDWTLALEPIWDEASAKNVTPVEHLAEQRSRVADALLSVTDGKAARAKSALVAKTYEKLRPVAKKNVEEAVPGLAAVLARHSGSSG
jgi:hypothetical protein